MRESAALKGGGRAEALGPEVEMVKGGNAALDKARQASGDCAPGVANERKVPGFALFGGRVWGLRSAVLGAALSADAHGQSHPPIPLSCPLNQLVAGTQQR